MVAATDLVAPAANGVMRPTSISQTTAVEQSRAVAEVLAAVQVAQQCPRDMQRAWAEMEAACARLSLAERAFYSVPNRGNGPSVHLARELARIWGNIDHGVRELRRDDAAGESEVQAFAWDQQVNVRATRSMIHPHAKMKRVNGKQTREPLIDLNDIYASNQNVGARAVRECIFSILPRDFVDKAQELCRATLERGVEGESLGSRITKMLAAYKAMGVTQGQIEERIGRKRGQWAAVDVADLAILYRSLQQRETSVTDEFPAAKTTAADLVAPPPASQEAADLSDAEIAESTDHN